MTSEGSPVLNVYHLQITMKAQRALNFHRFMGSAFRGALGAALARLYCYEGHTTGVACAVCPNRPECLVTAFMDPLSKHPKIPVDQVPRPYAIRQDHYIPKHLRPGEYFTWTLAVFGDVIAAYPEIVMALRAMGHLPLSRTTTSPAGGVAQTVTRIAVVNPFTRMEQTLWEQGSDDRVDRPRVMIQWDDAEQYAQMMPEGALALTFHTPLRIKYQGIWLERAHLVPIISQILLHHDRLAQQCGGQPVTSAIRADLLNLASQAKLCSDNTTWVENESYSGRQEQAIKLGGIMGTAVYDCIDPQLVSWLVWGTILQVGKAVTKGNGLYTIQSLKR